MATLASGYGTDQRAGDVLRPTLRCSSPSAFGSSARAHISTRTSTLLICTCRGPTQAFLRTRSTAYQIQSSSEMCQAWCTTLYQRRRDHFCPISSPPRLLAPSVVTLQLGSAWPAPPIQLSQSPPELPEEHPDHRNAFGARLRGAPGRPATGGATPRPMRAGPADPW